MLRKLRVDKARGLIHIHNLLKLAMKEGVGDIQLPNRPLGADCNGKEKANCGDFENWTERIKAVNPELLAEAFGNEASLVSFNGAIDMQLDFEHPLAAYNVHVRLPRNQGPSPIAEEGIEL